MLDILDANEWAALAAIGTLAAALAAAVSAWFAVRSRRDARRSTSALEDIAEQMKLNAALPAVDWVIEYRRGDTYALRNRGTESATSVRINPEAIAIYRALPAGDIDIPSRQSHRFVAKGTMQRAMPAELLVSCDQLPEVPVRMPP